MQPVQYTTVPTEWRKMLKIHGISAREVALFLGVNLSHFYNVLNGKASPTLEYAQKIETAICTLILRRAASNGDSNESSGDSQQRVDGGLPAESSTPIEWRG